jgi:MtN3 and saliva related transmembrane protein
MHMISTIGYLAAILTTAAYIPQVWKIYKTKDTRGLSAGMYALLVGGLGLWLAYGILLNDWPLIIANGITFLCAGYILVVKFRQP